MKYVISAGGIISAVVNNKLYILFITARNGLLTFPKGHVEKNETPKQAAIREIKEEVGLYFPHFFRHQSCFLNCNSRLPKAQILAAAS